MTELDQRVTTLETEMEEVRDLAQTAHDEAANTRAVLRGHTRVLNAMRKTQREHGERLDRLTGDMTLVKAGVEKITDLLTTALDRPDGGGDQTPSR